MMGLLDMMEKLADKKYKVFIQDNQPIFCDNVEIKNDLVYCTDFDCENVLIIPLIKVDAIKEYGEKERGYR